MPLLEQAHSLTQFPEESPWSWPLLIRLAGRVHIQVAGLDKDPRTGSFDSESRLWSCQVFSWGRGQGWGS